MSEATKPADGSIPPPRTFRARLNAVGRRFPFLRNVKRKIVDPLDRARHRRSLELIESLPAFVPNSAGAHDEMARLTLQAANQTFPFIVQLIETMRGSPLKDPVAVESFADTVEKKSMALRLKEALDKFGSDKANRHNYHYLYGSILASTKAKKTLEIGLGTNNVDVPSNMGYRGRPGASLRAFSDLLPTANIFGADVDKRVLFAEDRIKTFFVDQTDPGSFALLAREVGNDLDLIIDDGLHSPNANLATMAFALPRLRRGGWFVVEDIGRSALPIWSVVTALLPTGYKAWIVSTNHALMFAVHREDGELH